MKNKFKGLLKKRGRMKIMAIVLGVILAILAIKYNSDIKVSEEKLSSYDDKVKSVDTTYGKISYIDEGSGETILICHGLFGGYDQGYSNFQNKTDKYRILAPSRFGYPGTDITDNSLVKDQAKQYVELLDKLGIDKVYVLGTSAGGTCALRFAMEYPERVKGLILYCSGGIEASKPNEEDIPKYAAVPKFVCNNFSLWAMGPIMMNTI